MATENGNGTLLSLDSPVLRRVTVSGLTVVLVWVLVELRAVKQDVEAHEAQAAISRQSVAETVQKLETLVKFARIDCVTKANQAHDPAGVQRCLEQ